MNELNIAGNKILEYSIDQNVLAALQNEMLNTFDQTYNTSKIGETYLFRTPISLDVPAPGPGYQYTAMYTPAIENYKDVLKSLIADEFKSQYLVNDMWYLVQTNEEWIQNPIHQHLTADWVAVLYLKLNEGDAIEFFDDGGNSEKYYPKPGTLLVFPASVKHKPSSNNGDEKRISLNAELKYEDNHEETQEEINRYSICKSCDKLNSLKMCNECHCFMPFKIRLKSATCPLGKW